MDGWPIPYGGGGPDDPVGVGPGAIARRRQVFRSVSRGRRQRGGAGLGSFCAFNSHELSAGCVSAPL